MIEMDDDNLNGKKNKREINVCRDTNDVDGLSSLLCEQIHKD